MTVTGWRTTEPTPRAARPAARLHIVGLAVLAFALQTLAPALHARMLAAHATSSGAPLSPPAFCLPGKSAGGVATPDDAPRTPRTTDCVCCAGAMSSAIDPPAAPPMAGPVAGRSTSTNTHGTAPPRAALRHRDHQSRAPPPAV